MSVPIPALLEETTQGVGTPWVWDFSLQNEDGTGINGTGMEAHLHLWDEPRIIQYGIANVVWVSRNPAVIEVTVSPATLAAIGDGNTGFGDLLIVSGGLRQYVVRLRLTVGGAII